MTLAINLIKEIATYIRVEKETGWSLVSKDDLELWLEKSEAFTGDRIEMDDTIMEVE